MNKAASQPLRRANHFVPQGYLRFFSAPDETDGSSESGFVYVYDKEPGHGGVIRSPRRRSIKKAVALVRDYYVTKHFNVEAGSEQSFNLKLAAESDALERGFGEIERQAIGLIRSLKLGCSQEIRLSDDQLSILADFVSLSYVRTPSFLDGLVGPFRQAAKEKFERERTEESLRLWLNTTNPNAVPGFIGQMADILLSRRWTFLCPAPGLPFVTGDTPVCHWTVAEGRGQSPTNVRRGRSAWESDQEIFFPLRRDLGLQIVPEVQKPHTVNVFRLSERQSKDCRRNMAEAANRFVYADFKDARFAEMIFRRRGVSQKFFDT